MMKTKLLGLAAADRIRWRQMSRITWIKEGDANTKLFHLTANGQRQKQTIFLCCRGSASKFCDQQSKAQILLDHFKSLLGSSVTRNVSFKGSASMLLNFFSTNIKASVNTYIKGRVVSLEGPGIQPISRFQTNTPPAACSPTPNDLSQAPLTAVVAPTSASNVTAVPR